MIDTNTLSLVISAMVMVESGGDMYAVGDSGNAVGVLQQHKSFVDDTNRILDTKWAKTKYPKWGRFNYDSRYNKWGAWKMTVIWLNYYTDCAGWPIEKCIRYYNAGKNYRGRQAGIYYRKVIAEMERQKNAKTNP